MLLKKKKLFLNGMKDNSFVGKIRVLVGVQFEKVTLSSFSPSPSCSDTLPWKCPSPPRPVNEKGGQGEASLSVLVAFAVSKG